MLDDLENAKYKCHFPRELLRPTGARDAFWQILIASTQIPMRCQCLLLKAGADVR
jgi:hypothetical protein